MPINSHSYPVSVGLVHTLLKALHAQTAGGVGLAVSGEIKEEGVGIALCVDLAKFLKSKQKSSNHCEVAIGYPCMLS